MCALIGEKPHTLSKKNQLALIFFFQKVSKGRGTYQEEF